MKKKCNLELRLLTSSDSLSSTGSSLSQHSLMNSSSENQQEQQPMTIFYNGRICVCDVTEIQARVIIWLANRATEKNGTPLAGSQTSPQIPPLYSPTSLSMKRSLQRFLQKRKTRIEAASPYN